MEAVDHMQYLKCNLLFDGQPTRLRNVVTADPAGVDGRCASQVLSMATDSKSAVNDVVGSEYRDWKSVGIVELPAHFFLQSFLGCVQPAVWPTRLCIHEARALEP